MEVICIYRRVSSPSYVSYLTLPWTKPQEKANQHLGQTNIYVRADTGSVDYIQLNSQLWLVITRNIPVDHNKDPVTPDP